MSIPLCYLALAVLLCILAPLTLSEASPCPAPADGRWLAALAPPPRATLLPPPAPDAALLAWLADVPTFGLPGLAPAAPSPLDVPAAVLDLPPAPPVTRAPDAIDRACEAIDPRARGRAYGLTFPDEVDPAADLELARRTAVWLADARGWTAQADAMRTADYSDDPAAGARWLRRWADRHPYTPATH